MALHAGEEEKFADSHTMPIFATSTFSFPNADTGKARFAGEEEGYIYTRLGNPTVNASEKKLAFLEGFTLMKKGVPVEGHAFSTGMSAIAMSLMALTESGHNIVATNPVYGGTNYLVEGILKPYNVSTKFVDTAGEHGLEEVSEAINENTRVIYLESPANPNMAICDILEISKIAKEYNINVVVDNTFSTPILQRPLELGADISLHSWYDCIRHSRLSFNG